MRKVFGLILLLFAFVFALTTVYRLFIAGVGIYSLFENDAWSSAEAVGIVMAWGGIAAIWATLTFAAFHYGRKMMKQTQDHSEATA